MNVVLAVVGVTVLGGVCLCIFVFFAVRQATSAVVAHVADAGPPISIVAPAAVTAELAGAKRAYVGDWRSPAGTQLWIAPNGQMIWDRREPGAAKEKITVAIAAFHGPDIEVRPILTIVLKVSVPPRKVGAEYEMVVDGVRLTRRATGP
jgi:hypothetical protein